LPHCKNCYADQASHRNKREFADSAPLQLPIVYSAKFRQD